MGVMIVVGWAVGVVMGTFIGGMLVLRRLSLVLNQVHDTVPVRVHVMTDELDDGNEVTLH